MCSPRNTGNINFSLWLTGRLSQGCPDIRKVYVFKVYMPFSCPIEGKVRGYGLSEYIHPLAEALPHGQVEQDCRTHPLLADQEIETGEDAPRVSSRWQVSFLAVKNVVKFSVTKFKPIFPGEIVRKVAPPKKVHHVFHSQNFKISSPCSSGTALV